MAQQLQETQETGISKFDPLASVPAIGGGP
jgi:hypothetical protein